MSYTPITWGTYNVAYTGATPSKRGGTAPYTFSIQAGTLPTGITLNTSTGVISGTYGTSTGTTASGLVLRVTDSAGSPAHIDSSSFSLAIAATLTMNYTPVTTATYNVAYTGATPSTAGGTTSYVYTSTGAALPTGMTISSSTGVISGTDSTDSGGATYAGIIVTVTDAHGRVVNSSSFTITVAATSTPVWVGTDSSQAAQGSYASNTLTWTGVNFGASVAGNKIVVVAIFYTGLPTTYSSGTIASVGATLAIDGGAITAHNPSAALIWASIPGSTTSGTITIICGAPTAVWGETSILVGMMTGTTTNPSTGVQGLGTTTLSLPGITVPTNGYAIAALVDNQQSTNTDSFTNATATYSNITTGTYRKSLVFNNSAGSQVIGFTASHSGAVLEAAGAA
jgi:hypothetical protein